MRELADEGLTTREACGNSVRNITGCPYAGTSETEIFDVTPYAEAMTRYFLRHPLSGVLPRKFKIAFEGLRGGSRARIDSTTSAGARASSTAGGVPRHRRGRHVDPASVRLRALRLPPGRGDVQRRGGGCARVPPLRRL